MDYSEILELAEQKLPSEFSYIGNEIKLRISIGSTGGEIGSLVGGYLKVLRDQQHPAYLALQRDIDIYLSQFRFK